VVLTDQHSNDSTLVRRLISDSGSYAQPSRAQAPLPARLREHPPLPAETVSVAQTYLAGDEIQDACGPVFDVHPPPRQRRLLGRGEGGGLQVGVYIGRLSGVEQPQGQHDPARAADAVMTAAPSVNAAYDATELMRLIDASALLKVRSNRPRPARPGTSICPGATLK
jgi:hypothetical protein